MAFPWETHKAECSGIVLMNCLAKPRKLLCYPPVNKLVLVGMKKLYTAFCTCSVMNLCTCIAVTIDVIMFLYCKLCKLVMILLTISFAPPCLYSSSCLLFSFMTGCLSLSYNPNLLLIISITLYAPNL